MDAAGVDFDGSGAELGVFVGEERGEEINTGGQDLAFGEGVEIAGARSESFA